MAHEASEPLSPAVALAAKMSRLYRKPSGILAVQVDGKHHLLHRTLRTPVYMIVGLLLTKAKSCLSLRVSIARCPFLLLARECLCGEGWAAGQEC